MPCTDWKIKREKIDKIFIDLFLFEMIKVQLFCNMWLKPNREVMSQLDRLLITLLAPSFLGPRLQLHGLQFSTNTYGFMSSGNPNRYPHVCSASISLTDPPLRIQSNFWVCNLIWVKLYELYPSITNWLSILWSWREVLWVLNHKHISVASQLSTLQNASFSHYLPSALNYFIGSCELGVRITNSLYLKHEGIH